MRTLITVTVSVGTLPEWSLDDLETRLQAMDEAEALRFLADWIEEADDFIEAASVDVIRDVPEAEEDEAGAE